jgi:hypothetical protein
MFGGGSTWGQNNNQQQQQPQQGGGLFGGGGGFGQQQQQQPQQTGKYPNKGIRDGVSYRQVAKGKLIKIGFGGGGGFGQQPAANTGGGMFGGNTQQTSTFGGGGMSLFQSGLMPILMKQVASARLLQLRALSERRDRLLARPVDRRSVRHQVRLLHDFILFQLTGSSYRRWTIRQHILNVWCDQQSACCWRHVWKTRPNINIRIWRYIRSIWC